MPVVTPFSFPLHRAHEIRQIYKLLRKVSVFKKICAAALFVERCMSEAPIEMIPGTLRLGFYCRVANEELAAASRQKMK